MYLSPLKNRLQIKTNAAKNFAVVVSFLVFGGSGIFAQERYRIPVSRPPASQQPVFATPTTTQPDSRPLLFRNDASGRRLNAIIDTVEFILRPTEITSHVFNPLERPSIGERRVKWQQAFDTIETLAEWIDSDDLARSYYFYGRGMIYRDQAWSGLLGRDSSVIVARQAILNFENYVQVGLGNPTAVYESLAMLYFDFMKNPNRALNYLNRVLAIDPSRIYAYISKAQILRNLGRTAEACEALRQAKAIESLPIVNIMMSSFGC